MIEISIAGKVALFIAVPSTLLLFYWLLGRNEEEDDEFSSNDEIATSRQTVIEVKVPRSIVGPLIGRQGANIKKLQEESGARVNFKDESTLSRSSDDNRTVIIRGTSESAQKAELMIRKIIADMPAILTEEIQVPAVALGRIIGRGGENVRELSRISKAKIYIERTTEDHNKVGNRKVTITGSREQIDLAKNLIDEKIHEEEAFRAKKSVMEANREQRTSHRKDRTPEHDTHHISPAMLKDESWESTKAVMPEQKDYMEVYISAIEHPGHFWVQILSSEAMQLDRMTDEMNRFYSTDEAKLSYSISDISIGDMVAAPFESDNAWYRAKVIGIHEDKVDLYFVDFGDSEFVWRNQIRQLRPDFLSLKFQAVECKLANIKPTGENWSEAAIDFFEEITYCAQWKVLIAKTVTYESTASGMIPCLQLYDTNGDEDIDINEEMVSKKHGILDDLMTAGEEATASSLFEVPQIEA
ncbi:tudor and KH domain-containing protein isoform X3 [Patella vulgata]|uniref:tudor and KH domain-containing protein isoform X3 n=1 Tax=Patella vulgata TaxID=6465 RepID=UPI00217FCCEF|nr:tudor and KH domain-containing protein isoform X3 [Patella vulgata]